MKLSLVLYLFSSVYLKYYLAITSEILQSLFHTKSLNLGYVLYLKHTLIWIRHILSAQYPHVVSVLYNTDLRMSDKEIWFYFLLLLLIKDASNIFFFFFFSFIASPAHGYSALLLIIGNLKSCYLFPYLIAHLGATSVL